MKKTLNILFILALVLSSFFTFSGASAAERADSDPPPPTAPTTNYIYLPLVVKVPQYFSITGQVFDASLSPLEGATVTSRTGNYAISDTGGNYRINVRRVQMR